MKRVIIFEGPDGCGKTTLARAVRDALGAVYTHHGPYPALTHGCELVPVYLRSVAPALQDHNHVVLDRCWISELPYGLAYRNGSDRLGGFRSDYLSRELGAGSLYEIYLCLPRYEIALKNFMKGGQYLDNVNQFRKVYEWYEAWGEKNKDNLYIIDPFDGRDHLGEMVDV